MTVAPSIDPARFLEEHLAQASPDLLRDMLSTFINTLLSADADAICGADYRTVSEERTNRRNGYRHRDFDTRTGTIDVQIPKLRQGTYFPDWLLERRRAEQALTTVVATCYLLGVSTRRMEKLVDSLGITSLSKSQVSVLARDLDEHVAEFQTRPLDAGPYTFRLRAADRVEKWSPAGRSVSGKSSPLIVRLTGRCGLLLNLFFHAVARWVIYILAESGNVLVARSLVQSDCSGLRKPCFELNKRDSHRVSKRFNSFEQRPANSSTSSSIGHEHSLDFT